MPFHPDVHRQLKARLLAMSPRAFELFAGDLLEFVGLQQVSVTRYVGDGGIDAFGILTTQAALISVPVGVQVKRYRANIQRTDIDRFIGALTGRYSQGMFITTAGYAPQALLKATTTMPRVTTVDGDQLVALMVQHHLGIAHHSNTENRLDEDYFQQFEASARPQRLHEQAEQYVIESSSPAIRIARPEDDIISLRALSHNLRVDPSVVRRWIEQKRLIPDQPMQDAPQGAFFRRDRVEQIRHTLLGRKAPTDPSEWRQEFLKYARSHNMTKSYKPVMLKALLTLVNRDGEVLIVELAQVFRAFYVARKHAGLIVEFGPPDIADALVVSDQQLRQLIIKNPLERFLIKGFLEYQPNTGVVRFAPTLWAELRFRELVEIRDSANQQLEYYYSRPH
jgi:Restriction endonuclease